MGAASHIPRVLLAAAAAAALTLGAPRGAASLLDALAATAAAFGAPAPAADERAPRDVRRPLPAYDFVVVGAGAAGAAVAARLAAAANWTVLLLEAGGDENVISDVPLLASYMARSAFDWNFPTVASPDFCRALEGGRCSWHAGRVLGGTTVINYMVYSRGSPLDYDAWEALGNPGWGWKDVLPYFLRSEGARPPDLAASPFHGTKGPVTVDYGWRSPLGPVFLRAAREAGYPLRDPHGPEQLGFSFVQATVRRGARCSASKAYLRPLRDRRNLHVSKHSHVVRVVVDAAARRATGVRFRRRRQGGQELGEEQHVVARREVILSAGAMGSPKLLMLSGIGPAEHLKELGIPVVQDLRVGDNLQDHVALGGLSFGVAAPVTVVESRLLLNLSMSLEYVLRGRGALTLPGGAEVLGFLKLPPRLPKLRRATAGAVSSEETLVASASGREDAEEEEDAANEAESAEEATSLGNAHPASGAGAGPLAAEGRADVEVVLGPGALSGDTRGSLRRALGLRADYADRLLRELRGRDAFAAVPIVLRPRSRGRLRLRSADPAHPPLIYPNYLSHPDDVRAIAHGANEAVRLSRTGALRELGARLNPVPYPECEHLPVGEDAYWECAVRQFTISMQHQVGTCKMGPASDPTAVVDAELRVHGVGGLRVADASIMPLIPSGHTMAPAYMIGEKAADLLAKRWAPDAPSTSHRRR